MAPADRLQAKYSLDDIRLLAGISLESLRRVQRNCNWRRYEPGELIVEHLDRSNDVFFLISGEARVIIYSHDGKVVSFSHLGPGDTFGEYPALDGGPRSSSVEARTSCLIASMGAADFRELLQTEAVVMQAQLQRLVATIRMLSMRVYEFSAHIMAITGRRVYAEMQGIRAKDTYPNEEMKAYLVDATFPKDPEELTLKLSNVTAAFYGLMLERVGARFGWKEADDLSKAVFNKLGHMKTREAFELGLNLPKDTRSLALVFITAVHSASPEFNFDVFEYLPEETTVRVFGVSRYDRIAKKLNIERHLTWPELIPFFQGVSEEIGINCRIETELTELGEGGVCDCIYKFTQ